MANAVLAVDALENKTTRTRYLLEKYIVEKDGVLQTTEEDNNLTVKNALSLGGKSLEDLYAHLDSHLDNSIKLIQNSHGQAISNDFIVAVTADKEIRVKGLNTYFLSGAATSNNGYITINNPHKVSEIKDIIVANTNCYVLYEDGELYVMGKNSYGCLGIGNAVEQYSLVYSASNVEKIVASSSGHHSESNFAFIIKKDGKVFATGRNISGNLGLGDTLDKFGWTEVLFLSEIGNVIDVILAGTENAAPYLLTDKGELLSAGYNGFGNLGFNDVINRTTFQKIPSFSNIKIKQIVATSGYYQTKYNISVLALSLEGILFAFGDNTYGQLGTGDVVQKNNPVSVFINLQEDEKIEKIYAPKASYNFYLLTNKNNLYGAGNNAYGQLNQNNKTNSNLFIKVFENVKDLAITSCLQYNYFVGLYILTIDNKLFSVGYNQRGNLGVNSLTDIQIAIDTNFEYANQIKQISSGGYLYPTINILLENGKVFSCGSNTNGQILMPISNSVNRLTRIF